MIHLDWLIIGGGFHGTAISFYLMKRAGVKRERLRVLDPYARPLALWHHFTRNVGMDYLRSPFVHHLHYDPWSLRTFALTRKGEKLASYIPQFNRPSLSLVNAYHNWVIERYSLDALRLHGRAHGLQRIDGGWCVETDAGALNAHNVVLAMGASEQLNIPGWAKDLPNTNHIFDTNFVRTDLPAWEHAVVIGGGISAAQTALSIAQQQPGTVTLMVPHKIQVSHFDADPCWVTAICMDDFLDEPGHEQRRQIIRQARRKGSLPPNIMEALRAATQDGQLEITQGKVTDAKAEKSGQIKLTVKRNNTITTDRIVLCTGFEQKRPGGAWLDETIHHNGLPLAKDGYPIVGPTLRWSSGLYVTGPLAELEIGPVARNFIGARLASERIGAVLD